MYVSRSMHDRHTYMHTYIVHFLYDNCVHYCTYKQYLVVGLHTRTSTIPCCKVKIRCSYQKNFNMISSSFLCHKIKTQNNHQSVIHSTIIYHNIMIHYYSLTSYSIRILVVYIGYSALYHILPSTFYK